jgi:hypothetical protein
MAKIHEELLVIKISQITKDGVQAPSKITEDVIMALTQVAQELVGEGAIVEIESAE